VYNIARWLRGALSRPATRLLLIAGSIAAVMALVACLGLFVAVLLLGPQLFDRAGAPTVRPTQPAGATLPAAAETAGVAGEAAEEATTEAQAGPTATAAATTPTATPTEPGGDVFLSPFDSPLPTPAAGEGGDLVAAGAPIAVSTLEPVDLPSPRDALEMVATSQLTLSSVIFVEDALVQGARFQVRGTGGGGIWLAPDAVWITRLDAAAADPAFQPVPPLLGEPAASGPLQGLKLKLSFVGANPNPQIEPFDRLDTGVAYFHGDDPAGWGADAPAWGGVRYRDLYPGIDLELTGQGGRYVQRLVVDPGADLAAVRLRIEGATALALESPAAPEAAPGDEADPDPGATYLRLTTALGTFSLPLLQVVAAGPEGEPPSPAPPAPRIAADGFTVESPFAAPGESFEQPAFDQPVDLLYLNFLGQGGNGGIRAVAVDEAGGAYVTGHAYLPAALDAAGPFDADAGGSYDAFVARLGAGGAEMAYLAFVGGRGHETGTAIALDPAGGAYVAGLTRSADLPATLGAFAASPPGGAGGGEDIFAFKLDADGSSLAYATFLGGGGDDRASAIAVDATGSAYIAGRTDSADFPVTVGAWDTRTDGPDAFVLKLDAAGSGLAYATLLGGSGDDEARAIALDAGGSAYVTGATASADFPTTAGALDGTLDGAYDAFVTRLDPAGTALDYSTFLGGAEADAGNGLAVDAAGRAHVAGLTLSTDFPATAWAFDGGPGGGYDAFVARLDSAGAGLDFAATLGGAGDDWAQAVAVDRAGYTYLAGAAGAMSLPEAGIHGAAHHGGYDAFLLRFDQLGVGLAYAAFLGGQGDEYAWGLAVDGLGTVSLAGAAGAPDPDNSWQAFLCRSVVGTPFLDLPVAYDNFSEAALGNVGDRGPGLVNSWFDHGYPNHTRNKRLTRWDGIDVRFNADTLPRIGESWYDGHGGTDFRWDVWDETILAAAPGAVVDTVSSCRVGNLRCGGGFGNRVWIDHGNGYATVYAHLKRVSVSAGTAITDPAAQPLGIMGNTGRSFGTHLHFALYFDANRDGRWTAGEVVDPYGWAGEGRDPWNGRSYYLWREPLWTRQIVGSAASGLASHAGATFASPSALVRITLPPGTFASATRVDVWDMPPTGAPEGKWHATGRAFRLAAQPLGTGAGDADTALSLAQPLTLSVTFRQEDLVHLDPGRLALRRWDPARGTWQTLPSRVDGSLNLVVAETDELGRFDLHAPLLCPDDDQEPDDHYAAAQTIPADGTTLGRVLDIADDVDWFRFEAQEGVLYEVEARPLSGSLRPNLGIYDADSIGQLAAGRGGATTLQWRAPMDGAYLVRVDGARGTVYGCDAAYAFRVQAARTLDEVALAGPEAGTVGISYTFTATVAPPTSTQPIRYAWLVDGEPPRETAQESEDGEALTLAWAEPGTYRLTVTASNAAGTVTATHTIAVAPQVSASFTATPLSGQAPLQVKFKNTSKGDFDEILWDFGDGTTGQAKNPTHTYDKPGVYTVALRVDGPGGGDTASKSQYITVTAAPVAPDYDYRFYLPLVSSH
jgi:murein DD-endopeptidase MepM/ murein hydrolase activator NlpD